MNFTILIAEDQYLIKEGLKSVISDNDDMELINEEIGQPQNWVENISRIKPKVFITDHQSYQRINTELPALLKEISSFTNILIISDDQVPSSIRTIIDSGVKGFLTKHCKPDDIRESLAAINLGTRLYCQEVMALLLDHESSKSPAPNLKELSEREHEVLSLIGKGFTSREISEKLFISIHTVNSHRKNLLRKLNMKSPAQLIVFALEHLPMQG